MRKIPLTKSIVIIEDNADDTGFIHQALIEAQKDFALYFYNLGKEGLDAIHYYAKSGMPPALIIQDWLLPDIEGSALIKALKKDSLTARIPLLVLTGFGTDGLKQEILQMGADAFLEKPSNFMALKDTLSILIDRLINYSDSQ